MVNQRVDEEFPSSQRGSLTQVIASGTFHGVAHPTEGTATIYRLGDGSRILRFTGFKTSNGPDVHVYMVAAHDAKNHATVQRAGLIDLGLIKGNIGDQNYTLGTGVDLSKYRGLGVVQGVQCQLRSCTADSRSHAFAELAQAFQCWRNFMPSKPPAYFTAYYLLGQDLLRVSDFRQASEEKWTLANHRESGRSWGSAHGIEASTY